MSQFNNVRMESIFYGLNELKHEKLCLAQKLQEQKMLRQMYEQDLEQANTKYNQIQEKQRRMAETLAVAQHKINESLSSVSMLEGKISNNKPGMNCRQKAIEQERVTQKNSLSDFEMCLASIAKELFAARDFYKLESLKTEISRTESLSEELACKNEENNKQIAMLTHRLSKLVADETSCQPDDDLDFRLGLLIRALESDKQEMYKHLQRLKGELESVHQALKDAQPSSGSS